MDVNGVASLVADRDQAGMARVLQHLAVRRNTRYNLLSPTGDFPDSNDKRTLLARSEPATSENTLEIDLFNPISTLKLQIRPALFLLQREFYSVELVEEFNNNPKIAPHDILLNYLWALLFGSARLTHRRRFGVIVIREYECAFHDWRRGVLYSDVSLSSLPKDRALDPMCDPALQPAFMERLQNE